MNILLKTVRLRTLETEPRLYIVSLSELHIASYGAPWVSTAVASVAGLNVNRGRCVRAGRVPVCQEGVRNWESKEEAAGGGCCPRDSKAEIRFMTEASGPDGLAWWSPVSNSPDRPGDTVSTLILHPRTMGTIALS